MKKQDEEMEEEEDEVKEWEIKVSLVIEINVPVVVPESFPDGVGIFLLPNRHQQSLTA